MADVMDRNDAVAELEPAFSVLLSALSGSRDLVPVLLERMDAEHRAELTDAVAYLHEQLQGA